jgi:alpha-beta hydrolase superfamily lysophospholipase
MDDTRPDSGGEQGVIREDHSIASGDSELAAWLYRPSAEATSSPCVVLLHGFTATRDDCHLDAFCEAFAAAGFAALAFDYRHFGASGGAPRQLLDLKHQYEDCDAALRFARDHDAIDGTRIAIWGTSFAGGHALDAAVRNPWVAAALCLVPLVDGAVPPPGLTPRRAARSTLAGLRDVARARRGKEPYYVKALGPAGSRAAIPNDGAWEAMSELVPAHSRWRNEVAARILVKLSGHRPAKRAAAVACPLLVQIAEQETLLRNDPAVKAAERAPRGELRRYAGADHFDVYVSPAFDTVISDQTAFLNEHLVAVP